MAINANACNRSTLRFVLVLCICVCTFLCSAQVYHGNCDNLRNADYPFCDSSLSFDARAQNLVSLLSLDEKIAMLDYTWNETQSQQVEFSEYNWSNEALHGVAYSQATFFRPPTEFATVFPQIINLASSFNRQLFFEMANATGNEARAFYNVGNSGLTYWSPNVNIYRDPRWGRGHETPGEDPRLNSIYALAFVKGMQGDQQEQGGFLKTSACCKHFAAHSVEEGRVSFDSVVTEQDMADTYLPAFKSCVDADVSCNMCAYSAVNGIPACAHKELLTGTLREKWGFDGYIVADCGAVGFAYEDHHYLDSPAEVVHAILDAGLDVECYGFIRDGKNYFAQFLRGAVDSGLVSEQMIDTALSRALRVLFRLGYYEKDTVRPFKELTPDLVDSPHHRALSLEAARQSIVLLRNAPSADAKAGESKTLLPIDVAELTAKRVRTNRRASMALIGPQATDPDLWLGNYHGEPAFVKQPLDEIRRYIPDLEYERGCEVVSLENARLEEAEALARESAQVVLFVGINPEIEAEAGDRNNITFPGLQPELIRRVLAASQESVIMFVVSGGAIDLSEYKDHPKVGAIIWAGYLGQSAGEAIADVMFGNYNPSGRLTQTFYAKEFLDQVPIGDMNMRPGEGNPGRTYRFFTGEPVYPFGHGLSYTTFEYSFSDGSAMPLTISKTRATLADDCALEIPVTVRNSGLRQGDHSVLWFLAPPNAGQGGRPIKSLHDFERVNNVQPLVPREVLICLNRDDFQLANEQGEFQVVLGEWKLLVGNLERTILVF